MKTILYNSTLPADMVATLKSYCERVVAMPRAQGIADSTSTHPDMLGYAKGDVLYLLEEYYLDNKSFFDNLGIKLEICKERYGTYPLDVRLNAFGIGDTLVSLSTSTARKLLDAYPHHASVKQGYAKCSTLVMDGAIVTSDRGIESVARGLGCDTLLIEPGHITFNGYDYGFIGGAVCEVALGTLVAFGNICDLPTAPIIKEFAKKHNYDIIDHSGFALTDYGGVLIID